MTQNAVRQRRALALLSAVLWLGFGVGPAYPDASLPPVPIATSSVPGKVKCDGGVTTTCAADGTITAVGAVSGASGSDGQIQYNSGGALAGATTAAGALTFLGTPSSANLRALLSDETGTGLAYFQGGNLGTPSAGALNNATGLPISTGVSGLGTSVATALGVNVGSAGAFVKNNGDALSGTFSGAPTLSGNLTFSGVPKFTGLADGTVVKYIGLDSGNNAVLGTPTGSGTGCTVPGTANRILYDTGTACGDLGASTDGQLIVGQTSALPLWKTLSGDATLSAGGALTITNLAVTTAKINAAAVTYAKMQNGASNGLLGVNSGGAPTEVAVGSGCTLSAGTLNCPGTGSASGAGVQGGQSPSNIGDNTTALPSGHYHYATNVTMTAARTHALPDSATQGAGALEIFDEKQTVTATNQLCVQAAGSDKINTVTNGTACITTQGGSLYLQNDGAGNYTTGATANIPSPSNGQILIGKTGSPSNTIAAVTPSQDCTITNAGVITCTKTNNVSFGALATTTPGTGVATAAAVNLSANGGLTKTVFSGAKALATGAISSAACTSAQTDTATGTLTTDVVLASFNGDPTAVTGYVPLTAGMLTIIAYPTADTVNFKVCNNTSGSITPGAITLNWRVVR